MSKLFGTDGIRGIAGLAPLNAPTLNALAVALAELLRQGTPPYRVLIGRDTRISGEWIEGVLRTRLLRQGIEVDSVRVLSTPGVAFICREANYGAGVVISASHNPATYNGVKIFSSRGTKLEDELEERLEDRVRELLPAFAQEPSLLSFPPMTHMDEEPALAAGYAEHLRASTAIGLQGLRLVVDCAHGANWRIAPRILKELGAECLLLGVEPDGHNINTSCGSMHPENMCHAVRQTGAHAGICFDGDGDRVIFSDEQGRLVDGDHCLYLLARLSDLTPNSRDIVGTVMSNLGLEVALRGLGYSLLRAPVGDKFVYEKMLERGAEIGGEQSGHIILRKFANTGDGLLTALQLLAILKRSQAPLSALLEGFQRYPQILLNVPVSKKPPLEEMQDFPPLIRSAESALGENCRIVVRYSGTEPLLRVMVEGAQVAAVESQAQRIADTLQAWLR